MELNRPKKFSTEVHLSREMSLLDVTLIGVGAMIGAGIFVLTGIAAGVAGPALILAFALNGFVALLTAMSYAELGSCYHDAGGGYLWVKEGLPRWNGFLSGWMSWFAHAVACSLYALGFGAYFEHVLTELGVTLPHWAFLEPKQLLAVGIAIIFGYINFRGASETGRVGNMVTLAKIAILGIFIAFGLEMVLQRVDRSVAYHPFMPNNWAGVLKAMGLTFIAFQGFEVISQCSEEVKQPRKNIPRAVFLSLAIVIPIYLLVAYVALGAVRPDGMTPWDFLASKKETALVDVAKTFFTGGGIMLLIGGIISTMSALNATVYSSSRVAFAMGRDRNFPSPFGKVHPRRFTPHVAIFFSLMIVIIMSVSLPIEDVASAADIMFLLLFLQVNVTLIRLRKKRPDLDRGFLTPLFPFLTIVGIGLLLVLAVYMFSYSIKGWMVTAGWIVAGLVIYRFYAAKREIAYVRKTKGLERLERRDYGILVALSSPASAPSLVALATAVARKNNAEVILLHVIEVEEGRPLLSGVPSETEVAAFLEESHVRLTELGIPVRSLVRIAHRISEGIVDVASEEDCNFIVMGRPQRPTFVDRFFSSVIGSVVRDTTCEVAVLHGHIPKEGLRRILVPYGRNVHTKLAFDMAPAIVEYFGCEGRIAFVADPELSAAERGERLREIRETAQASGLEAAVDVVHSPDVAQAIVQQSHHTDMIVMGGRTGGFLHLLLGQSLSQEITEHAVCPVLWLTEYEEKESVWAAMFKPFPREETEAHRE
jgi:amino acid transporter/nucleotide-binding universal stress UspA family protein